MTAAVGHLFSHHASKLRHTWWSALVSGLGSPTFFLLAIGIGLGSQISDADQAGLGTETYLAFIGPGLLATNAMMISATEGMWPTLALLQWQGVYRAILTTPMTAAELAIGHTLWIGVRATVAATLYLVVLVLFGVINSWLALFIPFAAYLIGVAHAAPLVGVSAHLLQDGIYAMVNRAIIFPMFMFSGAFFPVSDMPTVAAWAARLLPVWHGVELCRSLALGSADANDLIHVAYLLVFSALGMWFAVFRFRKHVTP